MPISTIGIYGIEESASEAITSSVHTAPDYPSTPLIISGPSPYIPLQPKMDSNKGLQAMEEELAANQMKLMQLNWPSKVLMNELEVPAPEESIMEEELNFSQNS